MKNEAEFIELADYLLAEDMKLEESFERCLLPFLENKDFDAFSTLCYLLFAKKIKGNLGKFRKRENLPELPIKLNHTLAQEYDSKIGDWKREQKQIWSDSVQSVIRLTEKYYKKFGTMPFGMREYMERCGNALIHSTLQDGGFTERSLKMISYFLALSYKEQIKIQHIKPELVAKYESAHKFVQKYKIYLPYYYVIVGELWKQSISNSHGKDCGNSLPIMNLLSELPNVYKSFLYGYRLYPDNPREEVLMSWKGKDGMEPLATRELPVPFYDYLPTFCPVKIKDEKLTRLPCTQIYCETDMQLYLDNIYKDIELAALSRKIQDLEAFLSRNSLFDETDNSNTELQKQERKGQGLSSEQIAKHVEEIRKRLTNKSKNFADWARDGNIPSRSSIIVRILENAHFNRNNLSRAADPSKKHEKDTVIALAFAFGYSWEEARQFIAAAGYCLSDSIERDIVIRYALEKNFSLVSCNKILEGLKFGTIHGKKKT